VYATPKGLYLRSLDKLTANPIVGTEGRAEQPFFSPDGKWIGYYADGLLKKIAVSGGVPVTICSVTAPQMVGASWNEDNTIVYGQDPGDIMRVSANGGMPESIIKAKSANSVHPQMLPGGKWVLYTDSSGPAQGNVVVQSLGSGKSKVLFAGEAVGS
jgi:Tol biopolymer transport system component